MPSRSMLKACAALLLVACSQTPVGNTTRSRAETPVDLPPNHGVTRAQLGGEPLPPPSPSDAGPVDDPLSYTRLLRRVSLTLTGETPTQAELDALMALPDDGAKAAHVQQRAEAMLADVRFYKQLVDFGHDWLRVSSYTVGLGEGYIWGASQLAALQQCGDTTANPGMWFTGDVNASCMTVKEAETVEPWWAAGTQISVRKDLVTASAQEDADCGFVQAGLYVNTLGAGCTCGPNLIRCINHGKDGPNRWFASNFDERGQVRQAWEEPARLLAHVIWQDRPLSDIVLGNYSVAPLHLKALYLRFGRSDPATGALDNLQWWRPAAWTSPSDPEHTADDPLSWHEFVVESLNPRFLSLSGGVRSGDPARTYKHDPRVENTEPLGLPAAGVLTMMASNSAFSRERVRAARWLETLACKDFSPPPASAQFGPYVDDPATQGSCQQCHKILDPAAIHFKRWRFISYGGQALLGGMMRPTWHVNEQYGYLNPPKSFVLNTRMTPVSAAQFAFNKDAVLMDFLPPDQQLLGQVSDGTMGPLGFAKMLVASGEFDQCATRRLYQRFVGRDLDPAKEQPYITRLTQHFVEHGRNVRELVRFMMAQPEFQRGL